MKTTINKIKFCGENFDNNFDDEPFTEKTGKIEPKSNQEEGGEFIQVKVSDLQKMIAAEVAKATKAKSDDSLAEAILKRLGQNANGGAFSTRAVGIIPEEEIEETPTTFFVYSNAKTVIDDQRKGRTVNAPYNIPIKFKPFSTSPPNGRDGYREIISTFVTYAKCQKEFLREHSVFGLTIFEESPSFERKVVQYDEQEAMNSAIARVRGMSPQDVTAAIIQHKDIKVSGTNLDENKKLLIRQYAKEILREREKLAKAQRATWEQDILNAKAE